LLQDKLSEELRQEAGHEAHKLAGSLGMFGADEGSRIAKAIEPLLEYKTLEQEQLTHLSQLVNQLRRELHHITDGTIAELLPSPIPQVTDERPHLLVVADPVQTTAVSREAAIWGLRSHPVATLVEARQHVGQQHPDVVLLDLPGDLHPAKPAFSLAEALAFLADLSHHSPPIPVVVLTEQKLLLDRVKITRLGARRVLQKPVTATQTLETIAQVLAHTRTAATRVLVVDDDPEVLTVLQTLLEPWGLRVSTLDDPLRFLETLSATSPDLLMMDVDMPHINGIELCQVVRNDPQWSSLPILFLTVHTDAETMHRVFTAGADDFIHKPIIGPELITRILNRLERSRLQRSWLNKDALTGVTNRHTAVQELTQRLQDRQRDQPFCIAIVQVDQCQAINQQYGYEAGDQVLSRFGQLLRRTFHSEDVVGRWGGTEFIIGMAGMSKHDGMRRLSEVVENLQAQPFMAINGDSFWVQCTAGVVQCPQDGTELQPLYQVARQILRQAQATGGDRVQCS
jgi:diguanylate cyclase (GGDEF)-like protein